MGLLDKTPWSLECWEPNNQHQLWIEHPSPEDNGYRLLISTCTNWRLSINLQSIQSIQCIHLEKKKKIFETCHNHFQPRHLNNFQDLGVLPSYTELRSSGDGMLTFPLCLSQRPYPEGVKVVNLLQGIHRQALKTLTYWNSFELHGLGLLFTWVFSDLSTEQNWTFQTGKEYKMLRAGFQRAKLFKKDYWSSLTATWQGHLGSGTCKRKLGGES